ncbi:uncharacterized protein METZ01_LOCUS236484, partial [marine metagenome]
VDLNYVAVLHNIILVLIVKLTVDIHHHLAILVDDAIEYLVLVKGLAPDLKEGTNWGGHRGRSFDVQFSGRIMGVYSPHPITRSIVNADISSYIDFRAIEKNLDSWMVVSDNRIAAVLTP